MDRGYFDFAKYGSIGIAWVLSTSIYLYLGYKGGTYLDQKWGSEPLCMIVGLMLGIGLSLKSLMEHVLEMTKALDQKRGEGIECVDDRENNNNNDDL